MAQTTLFPPAEISEVRPGDIFLLGERHRLMCGDATDKAAVARLFAGDAPTLVVTSPPYAKQRDYDRPIRCWDDLMMASLCFPHFAANVQMLINLGVVHKDNKVIHYSDKWIRTMTETYEWRLYARYIWNKLSVIPGKNTGRLGINFEDIFHINKSSVTANPWYPCDNPTTRSWRSNPRGRDGQVVRMQKREDKSHRAPYGVINLRACSAKESVNHPAQMPVALASFLIRTWKKSGCVTYDPFGGSGTTLLAAEVEDVTGLAMEISPAYCQIALRRWAKEHPDKPIRKL